MDGAPRVALAGGGPAGAVAALVLARRGVAAVVLEAHPGPAAKVGETLPPSLAPLLRHLGLDALLARDGHLRSQGNRAFWGSAQPAESPFLAHPQGLGWHVDRRRFEARLAQAAQEAGVDWRWGWEVAGCTATGNGWRLALSSPEGPRELEVDFVADATGRPSRLARQLGAHRVRYDRLVGIAALLESPTPAADAYTQVEAVPDGWWYSALLADGRLAVAFFGDGDLLPRGLLGSESDPALWTSLLRKTAATRERVEAHGYTIAAPLRVLPADSSRLDIIAGSAGSAGDRWLALGDAAAAYDPLSSHGIASAMGSGFYGGNAIADLLAGREEARLAYLAVLQQAYGPYLDLLREHYGRERRWPESPFWQRRLAAEFGVETV